MADRRLEKSTSKLLINDFLSSRHNSGPDSAAPGYRVARDEIVGHVWRCQKTYSKLPPSGSLHNPIGSLAPQCCRLPWSFPRGRQSPGPCRREVAERVPIRNKRIHGDCFFASCRVTMGT
jgi:hypothetical protein